MIGAHVSASEGVFKAVKRIHDIGGTAFALFLKNERRWVAKPYEPEVIEKFKLNCSEYGYDAAKVVLPHGSYLINLANPDAEKRTKAADALLDDLQRCEQLGIKLYNLHPGSTLGGSMEDAITSIATELNKIHKKTTDVKIVLENMTGNPDRVVGTRLEHLAAIIDKVEQKDRVGVCIDTCHSLASGYDLRTQETFDEFWRKYDEVIGFEYLSGIHVNDSKQPLGSQRDLHENIGLGFVGLEGFRLLVNKPELDQVPKILETPQGEDTRKEEIALLKWLKGKSAEDILERAEELSKKGQSAREAVLKSAKDKQAKGKSKKRQTTLDGPSAKRPRKAKAKEE